MNVTRWLRTTLAGSPRHSSGSVASSTSQQSDESDHFEMHDHGWNVEAFRSNEARMLAPALGASDGGAMTHAEMPLEVGEREVLANPYAAVWRDQAWIGGSAGMAFNGLGSDVRGGVQLMVSASASTRPDGRIQGDARQELRRRPDFGPKATYVPQELTQQRGGGAAMHAGGGMLHGLGLIHGEHQRMRARHDSLILHEDAAVWLMRRHNSVFWPWLRDTVQSLVGKQPLRLPDPRAPEQLRSGEHMRLGVTRQNAVLAAVGFVWAFAGRLTTRARELQLRAEQQGHWQHVTVYQEQIASSRWVGVCPGMLVADRGVTRPKAKAWEFRFNMHKPSDRAACARLRQDVLRLQKQRASKDLAGVLKAAAGREPYGTEVLQDARQTSSELGLLFGLFPVDCWRQWLPRGFALGLVGQRFCNTRTHVQTDPDGKHRATVYRSGVTSLWGPRGEQQDDMMATVRHSPGHKTQLELSTHFVRSRATPGMVAQQILMPLNNLFGTQFPLPAEGSVCASREVSLSWSLDAEDVEALRGLDWNDPRFAAWPQKLREGLAAAASSANATAWIHAVARAMQQVGRPGFAAVTQALELAPQRLTLTADSDAYVLPEQRADALALLHSQPLHAAAGAGAILRRFAQVERALLQVEQTRQQALEDPLISDVARHHVLQNCLHGEARLRALLHVDGEAEQREIKRLMRRCGWGRRSAAQKVLNHFNTSPGRPAHDLRAAANMANDPLYRREKQRTRRALAAFAARMQNDVLLDPAIRQARWQAAECAWTDRREVQHFETAWLKVRRRGLKRAGIGDRRARIQRRWLQIRQGKQARVAADVLASAQSAPHAAHRSWRSHAMRTLRADPAPLKQALRAARQRGDAYSQRLDSAIARENTLRWGPLTSAVSLPELRARLQDARGWLGDAHATERLRGELRRIPARRRQDLRDQAKRQHGKLATLLAQALDPVG